MWISIEAKHVVATPKPEDILRSGSEEFGDSGMWFDYIFNFFLKIRYSTSYLSLYEIDP